MSRAEGASLARIGTVDKEPAFGSSSEKIILNLEF